MAPRTIPALLALVVASATAQRDDAITVGVPPGPSTRELTPSVYGYSIEPIWVDWFTSTPLASTLLGHIADLTGTPPPIRVGGNTADQTYQHPSLRGPGNNSVDSLPLPGLPDAELFNITPAWYKTWGDYFPEGTELIYTLNLRANESGWANAVSQAEAALAALGTEKLVMFELGNEIDHFINKGWRDDSWGVDAYVEQFINLTSQIVDSPWYKQHQEERQRKGLGFGFGGPEGGEYEPRPKFQAAVFADPPWVPDQHDEIDDFDILNLTAKDRGDLTHRVPNAGDVIGSYAVHMYPQSTCDPERWHRMRLDLLSDHLTLWRNVSQWVPQVEAAERTLGGLAPLVNGETNSVSCGGRSGISDTFGAALWGVDYVLLNAAIGMPRTYFHLGAQSEYSSFTPRAYRYKGEELEAGIRPGWYAHYFIGHVVRTSSGTDAQPLSIATLPDANSSSLSGFGVYAPSSSSSSADDEPPLSLRKLVFLDMGVWNGTSGLSNPSTISAADNDDEAYHSEGERPVTTMSVSTGGSGAGWCPGSEVRVIRLRGPGTNAKSGVSVGGVTFDTETGEAVEGDGDDEKKETLTVGDGGLVEFEVRRAEGVLLEIVDDGGDAESCVEVVDDSSAPALREGRLSGLVAVLAAAASALLVAW